MLWWVIGIVVALLALAVGVVLGIGVLLPQSHVTTRSLRLNQSPEAVWAVITDVGAAPAWRPRVLSVEMLPSREGRRAWREMGKDGALTLLEEAAEPPRLWVTRIADPELPFGGGWRYALAPLESGTRLTITEAGEVYNPLYRFVSRFILGHHATLEVYLRDLARRFGEAPRIGDASSP